MNVAVVAGRRAGLAAVVLFAALSMSIGGCEFESAADGTVASVNSGLTPRIINGTTETGWPNVGALVMSYPWAGFTGSFCSATLIDKRWALTAAHCVTPSAEFPIAPGIVYFMITSDARPDADGSRPEGVLVQVDYFLPHASYDGSNNNYDIALVHLTRDVTEVEPIPLNTTSIGSGYDGENFFYVGFGVNNGRTETGGGLKRSARIPVSSVDSMVYYSDAYNTAVCFGDSGGPALYQMGGVWKVVGVNSAVWGSGEDKCVGVGIHVRVDKHVTWLNQRMDNDPPACTSTNSVCLCDDVCNQDGSCDNVACGSKDCAVVTGCILGCSAGANPEACAQECYISGSDIAREGFDNVMGCYAVSCYDAQKDWMSCMGQDCSEQYSACTLAGQPTTDCAATFSCFTACQDNLCRSGCEWLAEESARADWNSFKTCYQTKCSGKTGAEITRCLSEDCQTQSTACFKPTECDLTGGDCPDGQTCRQFMTYSSTCVDSQGLGVSEKCTVQYGKPDPCADGLVCASGEGGRRCRQVCKKPDGCTDGLTCKEQPFPDLADWGWCGCLDVDGDTVCAADDCDDSRDDVFAGAKEICDGVDNNCDGTTDEDCTQACTDADKDGSCVEVDCDDNLAASYPGAVEVCKDKIDNDCNGQTDEDCEDCVNLDKDDYCADRDCNDRDYRISPSATEICDGIDNNCDGETDEDCPGVGDDVIGDDVSGTGDNVGEKSSGCSVNNVNDSSSGLPAGLLIILSVFTLFAGFRFVRRHA